MKLGCQDKRMCVYDIKQLRDQSWKNNDRYCNLNYNKHLNAIFMSLWINLFLDINRDNQQS